MLKIYIANNVTNLKIGTNEIMVVRLGYSISNMRIMVCCLHYIRKVSIILFISIKSLAN